MTIKTNNRYQPLLHWEQLTKRERSDFDWITDSDHDPAEFQFFRHKGNCYCMADFMPCPKDTFLDKWDGYHGDSFFSGVAIKLSDCGDCVKVATYIC